MTENWNVKKVFTRICLNNWGGIDHKILELNPYVNLFSGKSGSGKSTVMDAIQVVLYGSTSSNFLNKAADDSKNRRSVLSYLRGAQKDGTANRDGKDFYSTLVMEVYDTGMETYACAGIAFEVHRNDVELRRPCYFTHSGKMPADGYINEQGIVYSPQEIRALLTAREREDGICTGREINKIYGSKEAYLCGLNDPIMGYVNGARFETMQRSAIALKMSNGTSQFIKDYMFSRSEGDTITQLSEQLGAFQEIRETLEDIRHRIDLLHLVRDAGIERETLESELVVDRGVIRVLDLRACREELQRQEQKKEELDQILAQYQQERQELQSQIEQIDRQLIQVRVDIQASDLGTRKSQLESLARQEDLLKDQSRQWDHICERMSLWIRDDYLSDYLSNGFTNAVEELTRGHVSEGLLETVKARLREETENIEEELEETGRQRRDLEKQCQTQRRIVEDIENNRKSYPEPLRHARQILEDRLSNRHRRRVKVQILADLFDVVSEEWKNAVEGRLGTRRFALVVDPEFAHEAAAEFGRMRHLQSVDLLNTRAVVDHHPQAQPGSLFEEVSYDEEYVGEILKQFLGHIMKCRDVEELRSVRDGVTPDCYSYSGYMFRHLDPKWYERGVIGRKVSRARLAREKESLAALLADYEEIDAQETHLRRVYSLEQLEQDDAVYLKMAGASEELEEIAGRRQELEQVIRQLEQGNFRQLKEKETKLSEELAARREELRQCESAADGFSRKTGAVQTVIATQKEKMEELQAGGSVTPQMEEQADRKLQKQPAAARLRDELAGRVEAMEGRMDPQGTRVEGLLSQAQTALVLARKDYLEAYPLSGMDGSERTNARYLEELEKFESQYVPEYQKQFDAQCEQVHRSLRDNVLTKMHNDIKEAQRHLRDINRLLRQTNFADSIYQISIGPVHNEDGQYYDMLMAEELDSKNVGDAQIEGQISFGEEEFFRKYDRLIEQLTQKFIPTKGADAQSMKRSREEMERYADYRTYLSFSMYEQVSDENGQVIRRNYVDEMAGRDSGGEGQNPKYVALMAGFAMLYQQMHKKDAKIKLVLLDEAFSKMDQERSAVCLQYARMMDLQLILCVPDERLASLIRNVDSVYGFRRMNNRIEMMHIDKGSYMERLEGERA